MTYPELKNIFLELNQNHPGKKLTAHIVFAEDSFDRPYHLISRTYQVSSDNKAFQPGMGGYTAMGCWNETCMASRLPIYHGDRIAFVPLAQRVPRLDNCYPDGLFVPVCPPVTGEYDDYGNIESMDCSGLGAKLLRRCRFFTRRTHPAKEALCYEPIVLKDIYDDILDPDRIGDEEFVHALIDAVGSQDVYLEDIDPLRGRTMLPVHTAFIHAKFRDMALEAMRDLEFYCDIRDDVTYRTRQVGPMRDYLRRASIPDPYPDGNPGRDPEPSQAGLDEIKDLVRLHAFLDGMRVAWAPSTGTGSQAITDKGVVAFHKAVYDMAVEQSHRWD